uniref:Cytochrome b5 heme-binding domain-containing protein n=1 Tax=Arcella intermedia TaxID=1963864 RepID=A0A6B2L6R9_9EUKA
MCGFMKFHPGGEDWLLATQGTDCTESFQTHHLDFNYVQEVLKKYEVAGLADNEPSRLSFKEDDFYCTLRKRVFEKVGKNHGPTQEMVNCIAFFTILWFLSFLLVCYLKTIWSAILSGWLMLPIWGIGHNFFHQKDTPLRFILNITLTSSHEWRQSHAISHHHYPNSRLDAEVLGPESLFIYFCTSQKRSFVYKRLILFFLFPICSITFPIFFIKNLIFMALRLQAFRWEYYIPLLELLFLYISSGSLLSSTYLFLAMHCTFSLMFIFITWTAHHDQDQWHDGDPLSGADRDFGRFIISSTTDQSIDISLLLSLLLFSGLNDHRIHHLFPTIDRSRFNEIRTIYENTCMEFGIKTKEKPFYQLFIGWMSRLVMHTK